MFQIDIINRRRRFCFIWNADLQILAHEVIAIVHDDVLCDRVFHTVECIRRKTEGHFLSGLFHVVDRRCRVADFRLSIQRQCAGGKLAVIILRNDDLLLMQVEFRAAAKVLPIL